MIAPQTHRTTPRWAVVATLAAAVALALAGCGGDDGGGESTDAGSTASTVAADATETSGGVPASSETTAPEAGDTTDTTDTTEDGSDGSTADLQPGDACSLTAGIADCIDPDGDGEGTYLVGGAQCVAGAPDASVCEDLDGDGNAGYPDEFEDLPTCSDQVAPPCNNQPGGDEPEAG